MVANDDLEGKTTHFTGFHTHTISGSNIPKPPIYSEIVVNVCHQKFMLPKSHHLTRRTQFMDVSYCENEPLIRTFSVLPPTVSCCSPLLLKMCNLQKSSPDGLDDGVTTPEMTTAKIRCRTILKFAVILLWFIIVYYCFLFNYIQSDIHLVLKAKFSLETYFWK